ncbi:site-specific integrase [Candidatus Pacearchaeota archaeon]|nr:site-specific integrase [Candidatus Pacearchaeota archaeon]
MPKQKRFQTDYPGVYYIEGKALTRPGTERIYYIRYRKNGEIIKNKIIDEKVGRQYADEMTPARASTKRGLRAEGKENTNREKRQIENDRKLAEQGKWTLDRLWKEYKSHRPENKTRKIDEGRYKQYIKPVFGNKEPKEILPLDTDRLRIKLLKTKSPQTVKHALGLLNWIINFGLSKGLTTGLNFKIKMPTVDNLKTEDLTPEQLTSLLEAINKSPHTMAKNMMKLALCTGMRKGEMIKLKWEDIDFHRCFIHLIAPKGKKNQKIPINNETRKVLENHPRHAKSPFVFYGRRGKPIVDIRKRVNEIRDAAGIPKDFRALHGLRHVYASMLASSGQVDMYTLQKLLTHKTPQMTQRYAHLRDEALKQASSIAGSLIDAASKSQKK